MANQVVKRGCGFAYLPYLYMKVSRMIVLRAFAVILLSSALTVACVKGQSNLSEGTPVSGLDSGSGFSLPVGSSSGGGGGYSDENGKRILDRVRTELMQLFATADLQKMKTLFPATWDVSLVKAIVGSRFLYEPSKNIARDGTDLVLNYGRDEDGPYIEALKPLFVSLISAAEDETVQFYPYKDANYQIVEDLKIKVLHEICHHFGVGLTKQTDSEARECGIKLYAAFNNVFAPQDFDRVNKSVLALINPRRVGDDLVIDLKKEALEGCVNQILFDANSRKIAGDAQALCALARVDKKMVPYGGGRGEDSAEWSSYVTYMKSKDSMFSQTQMAGISIYIDQDGLINIGLSNVRHWNPDLVRANLEFIAGEIRFYPNESKDGKSYLIITNQSKVWDDCEVALLDGKEWKPVIGELIPVSPGNHSVECRKFGGTQSSSTFGGEKGTITRVD